MFPLGSIRYGDTMIKSRSTFACFLLAALLLAAPHVSGQTPGFEPTPGQPGKDVVWVPTPSELVEKMLDMAQVTPQDYVMDLGSGDGRNIIAAARRGARATGVEYNPDMVRLSLQHAKEAGVADKAEFVEGDMFEADISKATVLALFLLPGNLDKLAPKFLALKPGTRIVLNTFTVSGWESDATETVTENCTSWCTAHLVIVPAQVAGSWRSGANELTLTQEYQKIAGTVGSGDNRSDIGEGRVHGDRLSFRVGATLYSGRVAGDRIEGTAVTGDRQEAWTAVRQH
jgi:precorrin-6B methylase 2